MSNSEFVATFALVIIAVLAANLCADDLQQRLAARRARKAAQEIDDDDPLP
jgi:hypothetical protein